MGTAVMNKLQINTTWAMGRQQRACPKTDGYIYTQQDSTLKLHIQPCSYFMIKGQSS